MDENQQESTQASKGSLNPLLVVVILIIIAAVGVMLWLGSNKTATKAAMTKSTVTPTQAVMMQKEQPTHSASSGQAATQSATGDTMTKGAIAVEAGSFYFKPNIIKVKKGEKVTITLTNKGGFHDFVIDELNVKSKTVPGGETTTVEFTPTKAGSFEFYCSVGNHRAMGMKGTLIVE